MNVRKWLVAFVLLCVAVAIGAVVASGSGGGAAPVDSTEEPSGNQTGLSGPYTGDLDNDQVYPRDHPCDSLSYPNESCPPL